MTEVVFVFLVHIAISAPEKVHYFDDPYRAYKLFNSSLRPFTTPVGDDRDMNAMSYEEFG